MFQVFTLPSEPAPEGYQLVVAGVLCRRVYPTYDAALDAAQEGRMDDYEVVPVREEA